MNIKTKQVPNKIRDVERLAGKIKPHTSNTGKISGIKVSFRSATLSCFNDNTLAMYMIKANLAKSDDWIVKPNPGTVTHRDASLKEVPINNVINKRGILIIKNNCDNQE